MVVFCYTWGFYFFTSTFVTVRKHWYFFDGHLLLFIGISNHTYVIHTSSPAIEKSIKMLKMTWLNNFCTLILLNLNKFYGLKFGNSLLLFNFLSFCDNNLTVPQHQALHPKSHVDQIYRTLFLHHLANRIELHKMAYQNKRSEQNIYKRLNVNMHRTANNKNIFSHWDHSV